MVSLTRGRWHRPGRHPMERVMSGLELVGSLWLVGVVLLAFFGSRA